MKVRASFALAATALVGIAALGLACRRSPSVAPLRIGLGSAPFTLDPHLHDELATGSALGNVYEGLTAFDRDMRVRPALAVRWENPDDLTWRFRLRPGVRFHDGRTVTAADVAFSLSRLRDHPQGKAKRYLAAVREIRVLDAVTVDVRTDQPYPILLNKLTFVMIVPRDAPAEITHPIGTGPYRFVRYEPGEGLNLEAFSGYWGGRAPEARVRLVFAEDGATLIRWLVDGEVDVISVLPADDLSPVRAAACCGVVSRTGLLVMVLGVPVMRRPFSDARVRRALSLALDREAIVERLLPDVARPVGQFVTPQVFGYVPDLQPARRDVSEARRLLTEAGYPRGLDLVLEHYTGVAPQMELIRAQLAEVGVRVALVEHPWEEFQRRLGAGSAGLFFIGFVSLSGDASDVFDAVVHSRDSVRGYGNNNFTGYANPTLDRLIEEGGQTLDMARRRSIWERAMRMAAADLPLIPLWAPHRIYAVRRDVRWQPRLDGMLFAVDIQRAPGAR